MRVTRDCDKKVSKEHFISKAVLELLTDEHLRVGGLAWVPDEEGITVGIRRLTAGVLCARHNTQLSVLDRVAATLFKYMKEVHDSPESCKPVHVLSGYDLERWLAKVVMGMVSSGALEFEGKAHFSDMPYASTWVERLIGPAPLPPGAGLYVFGTPGNEMPYGRLSSLVRLADDKKTSVSIELEVFGLQLALWLVPPSRRDLDRLGKYAVYRPEILKFRVSKVPRFVVLSWEGRTSGVEVSYDL